jgi:RNA polymerase sigma factor (sigma-70 family)
MSDGQTDLMSSEALYAACGLQGSDAQIDAFEQLSRYLYRIADAMLRGRPGGSEQAADCMQLALLKIHRNLDRCHEPTAFRHWAASIVRRTVIDAIRQSAVVQIEPLPADDHGLPEAAIMQPSIGPNELGAFLRRTIDAAPLSDRSRRVVIGRFFEERDDAELARAERTFEHQPVLPSHIQVTRAKNLAKLRANPALLQDLRSLIEE